MVQYDWEILSIYAVPSVNGQNNVVKRITWRYQARDGSYAADINKDTYLDSPDPNQFIQYDNLTKETIVGWIESVEDVDQLNTEVLAKLDLVKNPSILEKPFPWDHTSKYDIMDMYVLVYNNEVVYGPAHWHSDIINLELEKLGLESSLPGDIFAMKQGIRPINQPLVINSDTKIFKADMQNEQPAENPYTDNGHIVWDFSTGIAVGTYVAVDKPIDDVKTNLKTIIAREYDRREYLGTPVTIDNETFKVLTGPSSRLSLTIALNHMQEDETCMWKFMENKWKNVSKSNIAQILESVNLYLKNLTDWEYGLVQQIDLATSVNDLREIEIR